MRRRSVLPVLLSLAVIAGGFVGGSPATACADGHMGVRWADFPDPLTDGNYPFFYFVVEGSGEATITIKATGDDCTVPFSQAPQGQYRVTDYDSGERLATRLLDYTPIEGSTGPLCGAHGGAHCAQEHTAQVAIVQDPLVEAVAERARALIYLSTMRRDIPFDVPLWIIDDDGLSRVSFESAEVTERSELYDISVAVLRAGPATAEESFAYTLEGTSEHPATPGKDFKVTSPQPLVFAPGERVQFITLDVVYDRVQEPDEELTITLTEPGPLLPEDPATAVIRILDYTDETGQPPSTRFHHPRHRMRYERGDYRLREFHVFARGLEGDAARVEIALRRRLKSGSCQWYTGNRFANGACSAKRWLESEYHPDLDWYYYRVGKLKPSVGTSIKGYTAFSRGVDGAGNVERRFQPGRNANSFEVERG